MRPVIRRAMFRDSFLLITRKYPGESRQQRRAMAWAKGKRIWTEYREKERNAAA